MSTITVKKNIVYHTTDREHLTGDLYLPCDSKNTPIVVMFHGGAYQAGSKEMYDDWGVYLAEQGYGAFTVNYRLATRNYPAYPGLLEDVNAALNYLVLNANAYNLDPQKIAVMGDSAGGYLASMLALNEGMTSYHIKSVVSAYGVFDLIDWAEYTNATRDDHVINKLFGFDAFVGAETYQAASPMYLIDKTADYLTFDTEFMVIWAEEDQIVLPQKQSIKFIDKLKRLNIAHEEIVVPGYGHFWFTKNAENEDQSSLMNEPNKVIVPQVMAFLERTLTSQRISDPTTVD